MKRWRYYCDFCKRAGQSGKTIAAHEKACTRNPERECRMCKLGELRQRPTSELLAILDERGAYELLAEVRCPACVIAAIHAFRKREPLSTFREYEGTWIEFDYTKAHEAYMGYCDEVLARREMAY